jgi:pilus assembly protein CpaC
MFDSSYQRNRRSQKRPGADHFGQRRVLLWLLCAAVANISTGYAQRKPDCDLNPATCAKIDDVIESITEPEAALSLPLRQSKLVRTKLDIKRVSAADPGIVDVVAFDTREIELIGKETGSTTMTIWLGEGEQAQLLSILVKVTADKTIDQRRRMEYGELQAMLNEMFPGSKIRLFPVADKVIVKGQARDAQEAERIASIIRRQGGFGGFNGNGANGGWGSVSVQGQAADPYPDGDSNLPQSTVISLLTIPGEQQVMLKVRIAELNRTAARQMGVDLEGQIKEFLFGSAVAKTAGNVFVNGTFTDASFKVAIHALETHGVAKILAEPNLVTLSGHPATFIAGGEVPVPTVVGVDGVGAASTYFKGFGAMLEFTPTVLDKNRIRLQVAPTFSSINTSNSVGGVPGLDTRAASTMVDLREGQVLAIAGLIQDTQVGQRERLPYLGLLPVAGTLFTSKGVTRAETELLIVVSPEIVSALDPRCAPSLLPGMEVTEPNDFDLYFRNQIEGRSGEHYRSTVWPRYRDELIHPSINAATHQQAQGYYMNGPSGLSN